MAWAEEVAAEATEALRRAGFAAWHRPGVVRKDKDGRYRVMSDQLATIREAIGPEVLELIRKWHDEHKLDCAAYSEGQLCCIETLTEGTE